MNAIAFIPMETGKVETIQAWLNQPGAALAYECLRAAIDKATIEIGELMVGGSSDEATDKAREAVILKAVLKTLEMLRLGQDEESGEELDYLMVRAK